MLSTGCCDWLFCLFFTSCLGWLTGYHWKESYWSVCLSYTYYHVHLLSGPDQSLLEEYEQRVQERQGELEALRKQREDLLNLEAMLQDLLITQVRLIMFQFWVLIFWFWVQRIMTCFLFSKQEQEKESSSKAAQQPPSDKREKIMAELERQQQLKRPLSCSPSLRSRPVATGGVWTACTSQPRQLVKKRQNSQSQQPVDNIIV